MAQTIIGGPRYKSIAQTIHLLCNVYEVTDFGNNVVSTLVRAAAYEAAGGVHTAARTRRCLSA